MRTQEWQWLVLIVLGLTWIYGGLVCGAWLAAHQSSSRDAVDVVEALADARPVPSEDVARPVPSEAVARPVPSEAVAPAVVEARGLFDESCSGAVCATSVLKLTEMVSVNVYVNGKENDGSWRFRHLLNQGLARHPSIDVIDDPHYADLVLWLPQWSKNVPKKLRDARSRLIILDEHDDRESEAGVPNARARTHLGLRRVFQRLP